ncbi:hypothetical protein GCM10009872_62450 [Actinopolymorpha rutila]
MAWFVFVGKWVLDGLGEVAARLVACGLVALVGLGLVAAPALTVAVAVPVLLLAGYGCVEWFRASRRGVQVRHRRLARASVVTALVVGCLAAYAITYCSCTSWW